MQHLLRKKSTAFTLIELLIVVAIIAILAAIAVPNFLEAQVRAKVSRAKSDMRSTATALESYMVDNNKYPLAALSGVEGNQTAIEMEPNYGSFLYRLKALTTPIAYITAIPEDPFAAGFIRNDVGNTDGYKLPWGTGGPLRSAEFVRPYTFDYAIDDGGYSWIAKYTYSASAKWMLRSIGPDTVASDLVGTMEWDKVAPPYDPTNGTASKGDIYMIGPGVGFDYKPMLVETPMGTSI